MLMIEFAGLGSILRDQGGIRLALLGPGVSIVRASRQSGCLRSFHGRGQKLDTGLSLNSARSRLGVEMLAAWKRPIYRKRMLLQYHYYARFRGIEVLRELYSSVVPRATCGISPHAAVRIVRNFCKNDTHFRGAMSIWGAFSPSMTRYVSHIGTQRRLAICEIDYLLMGGAGVAGLRLVTFQQIKSTMGLREPWIDAVRIPICLGVASAFGYGAIGEFVSPAVKPQNRGMARGLSCGRGREAGEMVRGRKYKTKAIRRGRMGLAYPFSPHPGSRIWLRCN